MLIQSFGNLVSDVILRSDNATNDLYCSMVLNTGVFMYSNSELVYFKVDSSFALKWFKRVHGYSSNPYYKALSSFVGSSNLWQFVHF